MPDLGKYAFEVTLAYAGSFSVIIGFVVASIIAHRRAMRQLKSAEVDR